MNVKSRPIILDECERDEIITALMELRNKYIAGEKTINFLNEVILKLCGE